MYFIYKKWILPLHVTILTLLSLAYPSNASMTLSGDAQWIIQAAQKPEQALSCTPAAIRRTQLYKNATNKVTPNKADKVLLYNLCGSTLKNSDDDTNKKFYNTLFTDLKLTEKITPVQDAILAAVRDPDVGCPIAGMLGGSLSKLNATNKKILCAACHGSLPESEGPQSWMARGLDAISQTAVRLGLQDPEWKQSRFMIQGDWNALRAVCGEAKANKQIKEFCHSLQKLPADQRNDAHIQKLYAKCVQEGHIKNQAASASERELPTKERSAEGKAKEAAIQEKYKRKAETEKSASLRENFYNQ